MITPLLNDATQITSQLNWGVNLKNQEDHTCIPTDRQANQPTSAFADNSASNMQIIYAKRHSPSLMEMEGLLPFSKGLQLNPTACLF
jgi:hypothetical protein